MERELEGNPYHLLVAGDFNKTVEEMLVEGDHFWDLIVRLYRHGGIVTSRRSERAIDHVFSNLRLR